MSTHAAASSMLANKPLMIGLAIGGLLLYSSKAKAAPLTTARTPGSIIKNPTTGQLYRVGADGRTLTPISAAQAAQAANGAPLATVNLGSALSSLLGGITAAIKAPASSPAPAPSSSSSNPLSALLAPAKTAPGAPTTKAPAPTPSAASSAAARNPAKPPAPAPAGLPKTLPSEDPSVPDQSDAETNRLNAQNAALGAALEAPPPASYPDNWDLIGAPVPDTLSDGGAFDQGQGGGGFVNYMPESSTPTTDDAGGGNRAGDFANFEADQPSGYISDDAGATWTEMQDSAGANDWGGWAGGGGGTFDFANDYADNYG